jgi:hypothetical protein
MVVVVRTVILTRVAMGLCRMRCSPTITILTPVKSLAIDDLLLRFVLGWCDLLPGSMASHVSVGRRRRLVVVGVVGAVVGVVVVFLLSGFAALVVRRHEFETFVGRAVGVESRRVGLAWGRTGAR